MSIGKEIVEKSKGVFATDQAVAAWIDHEIIGAVIAAKHEEEKRIEKYIAKLNNDEVVKLGHDCKFLHPGIELLTGKGEK